MEEEKKKDRKIIRNTKSRSEVNTQVEKGNVCERQPLDRYVYNAKSGNYVPSRYGGRSKTEQEESGRL